MKKNRDVSGLKRLIEASDEDLIQICKQNRNIIEKDIENEEQTGIVELLNSVWGVDAHKYNGPFYKIEQGEAVPIVPLIWTGVEETNLGTLLIEYAGQAQNPKLERVFPTTNIRSRKKVTYKRQWHRSLLDQTKPGVPGSGFSSDVKKWVSQTEFYGKALEADVWAMQSPEQVRHIMDQLSLYIMATYDTFMVLIFTVLHEMTEPIYETLMSRENNDESKVNRLMLEKYMKEWNCILNEHPLATIERNKIEGNKYTGSNPETMLLSATSSIIIRKKERNLNYYMTGGKDNGTGLLDFDTRPDKDITSMGTTPVLIVEDYSCREFSHSPLSKNVIVGEYVLANNRFIDEVDDTYDISQMSPYIGDYQSGNGEKVQLKIEELYENASPFNGNNLVGIDGDFLSLQKPDGKKFISVVDVNDKVNTITYFGDMVNDKTAGCTTEYFSKLAKTLRIKVLKSIGYTSVQEIQLLSKVSKVMDSFDQNYTKVSDLHDAIDKMYSDKKIKDNFNSKPVVFYSYEYLKRWANNKIPDDLFSDEKTIMKEYVNYLDGIATILETIFGSDNLLFENGKDIEGSTDPIARWIDRTFFNSAYYKDNNAIDYPITPKQATGLVVRKNGAGAIVKQDVLTFKDGYKISDTNMGFANTAREDNLKTHINAIKDYTDINTSTGPILLTYLCAKFTDKVINNLLKNDVAPPFSILSMRIMNITTDSVFWVKAGVTLIKQQGITSTLKESSFHGYIAWQLNTEMGVCSNDPEEFYKSSNIRIKSFNSGAGSKIFDINTWAKNNDEFTNEEQFYEVLHKNDKKSDQPGYSFFSILVPPETIESDYFNNRRFSFRGDNIFKKKGNDVPSFPGYSRYIQMVKAGEFSEWNVENYAMSNLFYRACSEIVKDGKTHKIDGELFHTIENGSLKIIIDADNYITDNLN
jgi:hypothetical protein